MNKNMGSHKRKGPHRGAMQNKGKGENEIKGGDRDPGMNRGKEIHRVEPSDEHTVSGAKNKIHRAEPSDEQKVNQEKEMPRTEFANKRKPQEEQRIHPVDSSGENIQIREKETHRMVSWNRDLKDRERANSGAETTERNKSEENKSMSEVEIQEAKSQAAKNTDSVDGYDATVRAKMYNQDPVSQPVQTHRGHEDQSRMEDIRSAPAIGTVLYTVAVLLVIGWAIGFFFYDAGDLIHVLLVLALFSVLIKVAQGRSEY